MPKFVVTVISSFKHKILVEAEDAEDAQVKAENADYYQRHMGEIVTKVKKVKGTKEEITEGFRKKGYF